MTFSDENCWTASEDHADEGMVALDTASPDGAAYNTIDLTPAEARALIRVLRWGHPAEGVGGGPEAKEGHYGFQLTRDGKDLMLCVEVGDYLRVYGHVLWNELATQIESALYQIEHEDEYVELPAHPEVPHAP